MSSLYLAPAQRPRLVSFIAFVYLTLNLSLLGLLALDLGHPQTRADFLALSLFARVMSVVSPLLEITAAVALALLRRVASALFTLDLVLIAAHWLTPEAASHAPTSTYTLANAVGTAIAVAVCLYSWQLRRRGTLH